MTHRILVAEDDSDIAGLVQLHLRDGGYEVDVASDGRVAQEQALPKHYDLVVLDVMLPGLDGLEVCRRLRARPRYPLILMLTARSSELDRVLGLEVGADDYLTKPFSPPGQRTVGAGTLVIDTEKRLVTLGPQPVSLTAKEFDLLLLYACHPGRVYTRAELLDLVWSVGYEGYEHTVNSHINRLRAKIEPSPARPALLLTVWGVGYKFAEAAP